MIHPQPYHWILLLSCIALALFLGVRGLTDGFDSMRGFVRIVAIFDRVGLIVFSAMTLLRQFWAIDGLIFCFFLFLAENLLSLDWIEEPEVRPAVKWFGLSKFMKLWGIFVTFVIGVPIVSLIWLRHIFIAH
jgi:hypothetical protein